MYYLRYVYTAIGGMISAHVGIRMLAFNLASLLKIAVKTQWHGLQSKLYQVPLGTYLGFLYVLKPALKVSLGTST